MQNKSKAGTQVKLLYPESGFLLSIEEERNLEFLSESLKVSRGVFLTQPLLIKANSSLLIDSVRAAIGTKLLIADTRLDLEFDETYEFLSQVLNGVDAMTVMAVYGKDFVQRVMKQARQNIYAIIDVGSVGFAGNFSDDNVVSFAKTAKDCLCRGVLMTTRFPGRIRKVRESIGEEFEIVAAWHPDSNLGDGLLAGANLEIVNSKVWARPGGVKQLANLQKELGSKRR